MAPKNAQQMSDHDLLVEIHTELKHVNAELLNHKHAIFGNGKPGLIAEVREIQQIHRDCPARSAFAEAKSPAVRQGWATIWITLVSTVLGSIVSVTVALIAIVPEMEKTRLAAMQQPAQIVKPVK